MTDPDVPTNKTLRDLVAEPKPGEIGWIPDVAYGHKPPHVLELPAGKREEDIAAELKAEVTEALKPVLAVMQRASAHKMLVAFDGITPNQFGMFQVNNLRIMKIY